LISTNKKPVAVAMSGGVDSSVAAALLLEKGHDVFGITMLHFDAAAKSGQSIIKDAKDVCDKLGIKHFSVQLKTEFRNHVIKNFIDEYLDGRTPNPCVKCNVTIKWGELLNQAKKLGADYFATGHYTRVGQNPVTCRYELSKAAYIEKDQSYALWRLSQEQLSRTIFPLGELSKNQVRETASNLGLDVATKSESQEICFIEDDNYRRFLREELQKTGEEISKGEIKTTGGQVVGSHNGYPFYTIGQRKGLGVALGHPMYVTKIDKQKNQIVIGDKTEVFSQGFVAGETNWISTENAPMNEQIVTKIRYNNPGHSAVIKNVQNNSVTVEFSEPRAAVTPGQSAVFYDGDKVVGGGIILESI
jgi:tRNA-uridine 2-sulfurtransferase